MDIQQSTMVYVLNKHTTINHVVSILDICIQRIQGESKMKIKWRCPLCKDILVSDSKKRHTMDWCKCSQTGVDLEEYYCRIVGNQPDMWEQVTE